MLFIGITGGIGSGKTTVARIFETLGIPVYYADAASKRLMNEDAQMREAIIREFGKEAFNGTLPNREYIASKVFGNADQLQKLNAIVHPATIRDAAEWVSRQKAPYALKEAAILFESGTYKNLDKIIGVAAPESLRIERAMQRDQSSREKVLARMQQQMDESEKLSRCDYIIHNDEIQPLIPQVLQLHKSFLELAENG